MGDIDGDGDLDLAVGNEPQFDSSCRCYISEGINRVHLNIDGKLNTEPVWQSNDNDETTSVAWGDVDGDGDLDLAVGNEHQCWHVEGVCYYSNSDRNNKLYINVDGILQANATWQSDEADDTQSVAWGDMDGDGDLDLAVGNVRNCIWDEELNCVGFLDGTNKVYLNVDGELQTSAAWRSDDEDNTFSVAWGDMDGDGDLDLAVGNNFGPAKVYLNEEGMLQTSAIWQSVDNDSMRSVAWGDMDGDGDLDLAVGSVFDDNKVFLNENGMLQTTAGWTSGDGHQTESIAWGDVDGDGDLDLAAGNSAHNNSLYLNINGVLQTAADNPWKGSGYAHSVAFGDIDGDGDLDLASAGWHGVSMLYVNGRGSDGLPTNASFMTASRPITAPLTSSYVPAQLITDTIIPIPYSIFDHDWKNAGHVKAEYSLNGGGQWFPAVATTNTITTNLQSYGGPYIGLTAHWKWDEGITGTASFQDSSVYAHHGTAHNGVAYTQTIPTKLQRFSSHAITLNGLDSYITIEGAGTITSSWTVGAWAKRAPDSGTSVLVSGATFGLKLIQFNSGKVGFTHYGEEDYSFDYTLPSDQWVHLSFVGTLTETQLYVDGSLVDAEPVHIDLQFGHLGSREGNSAFFKGELDDVRIYRRALSLSEIQHLANPITHIFYWDTFASGFFGQSDNVVFRIEAYPQPATAGITGTYPYTNRIPFPIQRPYASATTYPFRVRGTQVQVLDGVNQEPIPNAQVYRLPESQTDGGFLMPTAAQPLQTNSEGILQGRGELALGDGLYAMLPVTTTYKNPPQLLITAPDTYVSAPITATTPITAASVQFWMQAGTEESGTLFVLSSMFRDEIKLSNPTNLAVTIAGQTIPTGVTINDEQWHHLALTWQSDSGQVILYLDGHQVFTGFWAVGQALQNGDFILGQAADFDPSHAFNGHMNEVSLWNVARTAQEIKTAVPLRLRGDEKGLLGYWRLDDYDEATNTLNDLSPHGHDGVIVNGRYAPGVPKYTVYHTSGVPTPFGLDLTTVDKPGVQTLTISDENKLILFDLDVSLEWDASQDNEYLDQLNNDLRRASEIIFDLSNGQVALGEVRVFLAKEQWDAADVRVYASNNQRPSANLGGIVNQIMTDTFKTGEVISNAFMPGKIRMGATWNRYGNPGGTIGEDWPRVLAHEFGHYALFMLDNYLGIDPETGLLVEIDCQGSVMTDAYRQDYSEFLSRHVVNADGFSWAESCEDSLAEATTGRSDWETFLHFYPFMSENIDTTGDGPGVLPLDVTQVTIQPYDSPITPLDAPFFYIADTNGDALPIPRGQAQGYLYKTNNTPDDPSDDELINIGTPNGPLIQARGAAPGDRVCVYDHSHNPPRLGCLEDISALDATIKLEEVPGWQPQIVVRPVNSTTIAITVTQQVSGDLYVQLFPGIRPTPVVTAPVKLLNDAGGGVYTQTIQFPLTVFDGYVRVWEEGVDPVRESLTRFSISRGWNGNDFIGWNGNDFIGWNGNDFIGWNSNDLVGFGGNDFIGWNGNDFIGWNGNDFIGWNGNDFIGWNAPVASPDGQVVLFNTDNILAGNAAATLQALTVLPELDSWLTPVGQVYRYQTAETETNNLVIQFQYLERELPAIQEGQLRVYYLNEQDSNAHWQRLETEIDDFRNLASAKMRGEGLYALLATIETPALQQGWNLFAYPAVDARPPDQALASISEDFSSVYYLNNGIWFLHDQTVVANYPKFAALVNDLTQLDPLHVYWIYAVRDTVPYIGVPNGTAVASNKLVLELPPATIYGWVNVDEGFDPQVGDLIVAKIGNVICGSSRINTIGDAPGRMAYKIQIKADSGDGCGDSGREISFMVGDVTLPGTYTFNVTSMWNRQAWFYELGKKTEFGLYPIYLPLIGHD